MVKFRFLTLDEILDLHVSSVEEFGGLHGIRDVGLLISAVYTPQASFGGEYVHSNIADMAAAYMYHLIKNHAFLDGNKRVGVLACLSFLYMNGYTMSLSQKELFEVAMAVAESRCSKNDLGAMLCITKLT